MKTFKIFALSLTLMIVPTLQARQVLSQESPSIYVDNFVFNYLPTNAQKITLDKYMNLGLTSNIELRFRPRLFKGLNNQASDTDENSYVTPKDSIFKLKYYLMKPIQEIVYTHFDLKDYKLITAGESDARVVSSFARSYLDINYDFTDLKALEKKNVMLIVLEIIQNNQVFKNIFAVPYEMFNKESAGDIEIINDKNQLIDDLCHEQTVFEMQKNKKLSSPFNSYIKALSAETNQMGKKLFFQNIKESSSIVMDNVAFKVFRGDKKLSEEEKIRVCEKLLETKVQKNFLGQIIKDEKLKICVNSFDQAVKFKKIKIIDEILTKPKKVDSFHGSLENLASKEMTITVEESTTNGSNFNSSVGFNLSAEIPFSKAISFGSVSGGASASVSGELYVNQSKSQTRSLNTHVIMRETTQLNFEYRKVGLSFNANSRTCILITLDNFVSQVIDTSWTEYVAIDTTRDVVLNSKNNYLYCTSLVAEKMKETWFFVKKSNMSNSHLFDAESSEVNENMMELIRGEKNFNWLKNYLAQASSLYLVVGPLKADGLSPVIKKFFPEDEINQAKKSFMSNSFPGVIEL